MTRKNTTPRDFAITWEMTFAATSPWRGAPSGDAKRGADGDLAKICVKIGKRNHKGSAGCASLYGERPVKGLLGEQGGGLDR